VGNLFTKVETGVGLPRSGTRSAVGRRRTNREGSDESASALHALHVKKKSNKTLSSFCIDDPLQVASLV